MTADIGLAETLFQYDRLGRLVDNPHYDGLGRLVEQANYDPGPAGIAVG